MPEKEKMLYGGHEIFSKDVPSNLLSPTPLTEFFRISLPGGCTAKGIGMRNRGFGDIDLTGEIPPGSTIEKAFLYWAVMFNTDQPENPTGKINDNLITGTLIASPQGPCWSPPEINIYRADVTSFANNNINSLTEFPSGVTNSTPPQDDQTPPLLEGASLVVIFRNPALPTRTIIINDGGETITGFQTVSTSFNNIQPIASPVEAKTIYIVADGQFRFLHDTALFNNQPVAGPGTLIKTADAFDGADGRAIPGYDLDGLWDTLTLDVSSKINVNDIDATASISDESDCLTYIAQVLYINNPSPTRGINFISLFK